MIVRTECADCHAQTECIVTRRHPRSLCQSCAQAQHAEDVAANPCRWCSGTGHDPWSGGTCVDRCDDGISRDPKT